MVDADTIIDGRYKVLQRIGSGGMAEVYLAEDLLLGRQLAVKLLYHHFAEDQDFVERFRREASSAAGLSHPNIVGIFDRGEWDGTYYITMEYVPGRPLKTIVREHGALDPTTAIDVVIQILRAARFAHKRGVIHRDLKPHNVLIDEEGRARVTDFGIARAGASDMTLTGSIMGTAQYLSPEQAQGHAVTATSDLYAVGVILYELLTGTIPFEGETAVAIAMQQVSAAPRPPSALNPTLPVAVDAIVLRALTKDPSRRYKDADEFIAVLQRERQSLQPAPGAVALTALPSAVPAAEGMDAAGVAEYAAAGLPPGPPRELGPADTGSGALLLPAAGPWDGDPASGQLPADGPSRRTLILLLAAVLAVALVALALVLLLAPAGGGRVRVPDVTGQTEPAAVARLRQAGLSANPSLAASTIVPSGLVIGESPTRGSVVAKGTRVGIVVSSGPSSSALVNVAGLTGVQAVKRLRAAGFDPTTSDQPSATVPRGRAISTDPSAGTVLQAGSAVTVFVSSGPAKVRVPDVTGQPQAAAEAALSSAGLAVGSVSSQISTAQAPGTVLTQSPRAGASVSAGGKVNLTLAQAPKEITVPGVVGQGEAQAAAALGSAGFNPKTMPATVTDPKQVGIVSKQTPPGGHTARRGATVTLTVGVLASPTTTTPSTQTTPPPATTPTLPVPPPAASG
ncbi:MAG TPA: Stk1 family PASTA domain-containing Ser/Thr kinase [Solirubrobacteraceae bacterium]|jgi:serine/threonine-protein kinase